ncbi:MazG nucleotide pyrophosphohydrolase family protein [Frankia torreyi]|uniref:MazG nucleotide pyrophosphohydrolase family protein n=1 Tax=Frankia torreyi TaxID=1856 RepID=A0A0D8BAT0_9ACTN|nr:MULTISPECIES: dATP/dGTP pyrophosphohydrolase domain-containing protein [Frankia]KJE21200.1 MazG nucleotide pyrophosphohydrolase family protein [Frankia torreyi]KQM06423.1 MazG nucleotide pyrophosphohydrolase family protein [Frankia sp. CpI1-P]
MQPLAADASLADLQRYVAEMETERGFTGRTVHDQTWRLMEEAGELARAVRKNDGQRTLTGELVGSVDEELVDILIFACSIANRLGIDLTDAIRAKEALNETRSWPGTRREAPASAS